MKFRMQREDGFYREERSPATLGIYLMLIATVFIGGAALSLVLLFFGLSRLELAFDNFDPGLSSRKLSAIFGFGGGGLSVIVTLIVILRDRIRERKRREFQQWHNRGYIGPGPDVG